MNSTAIAGVSSALALAAIASCVVFVKNQRESSTADESEPDKRDDLSTPAMFGIAPRETWSRPFFGSRSSSSSSSGAHRDSRFVNIFARTGELIPQFNPNLASAVVIGSVTIGGSSSLSTGPFAGNNMEEEDSYSSRPFALLRGNKKAGCSSNGDVSSLSSAQSSSNVSFSTKRHYGKRRGGFGFGRTARLESRHRVAIPQPSKSFDSQNTPATVPMNRPAQRLHESRINRISLGELKAVAYMSNQTQPSDSATNPTTRQRTFLFDTLCAEANSSSGAEFEGRSNLSVKSLPVSQILGTTSLDDGPASILRKALVYFHSANESWHDSLTHTSVICVQLRHTSTMIHT